MKHIPFFFLVPLAGLRALSDLGILKVDACLLFVCYWGDACGGRVDWFCEMGGEQEGRRRLLWRMKWTRERERSGGGGV